MTRLDKELSNLFAEAFFPTITNKSQNEAGSYPPYNIRRKSKTETVLELALAGFKRDEIKITRKGNQLYIKSKKSENWDSVTSENFYPYYIHKGIGTRSFTKQYTLANEADVTNVVYEDGILSVHVSLYEEAETEQEIPIGKPAERSDKQFLKG